MPPPPPQQTQTDSQDKKKRRRRLWHMLDSLSLSGGSHGMMNRPGGRRWEEARKTIKRLLNSTLDHLYGRRRRRREGREETERKGGRGRKLPCSVASVARRDAKTRLKKMSGVNKFGKDGCRIVSFISKCSARIMQVWHRCHRSINYE